jgi:flagellar P-ring protein precursor FlgI
MRRFELTRPGPAALLLAALLLGQGTALAAGTVRVKDLGKLRGWRGNVLVGYGIVTGLAGTGDSPTNRSTRQTLANVLSQFDVSVSPEQVQSRNVAVVMVSATLTPFAREGDALDATVSSAGDARSLLGGTLLLAPLKGPDGRVHALASGPLSVGGYRYDANGNVQQKNLPTMGIVPAGATVEVGVKGNVLDENNRLTYVLAEPDYVTATRMAQAVNATIGAEVARVVDASAVEIAVPEEWRARLGGFLAKVETVEVTPDRRARVVVNERTGTVVAGGDVGISPVAISHGDLKVSVTRETTASQPDHVFATGPGVRTALVTNTRVQVDEGSGQAFVEPVHNSVADLVQALVKLKTNTRDIIAILQAIKAAGALHAELVIQ